MQSLLKSIVFVVCSVFVSGITMLSHAKTITSAPQENLRVATFNVSMEALNYVERVSGQSPKVTGNELTQALKNNAQQIRNIAEIIQRINPDIILLNEFDRTKDHQSNLQYFIKHYLNKSQHGQAAIDYPFVYQGKVNTGVKIDADLNNDGKLNQSPADTHGFGYFEGHFGMALLSKYPIDEEAIRTFQLFKWHHMPNALKPITPSTKQPWYSDQVWKELRLSSKSHWDIPIKVNDTVVHVLASHPTPPVFDGPEDRNGKRNHDEIRFWVDYINDEQAQYIYDDSGKNGGLHPNQTFVVLGDLNASNIEGDAINTSINALLTHEKIQDSSPISSGGDLHKLNNKNSKYHTAYWGMRADYVLPSRHGFTILDSGVFWPKKEDATYRLIKDRKASSDHRLVWVDLEITK